MRRWISVRLWYARCWLVYRVDKLAWRLAFWVPRKVALYAFVRVFGATITELSWDKDELYRQCYQGWEEGNGK